MNFGDEILVAHGAKSENWDPRWQKSELSILKKDDWTTSNALKDADFIDIVAVNKRGTTTYLASFNKGLAKMTGLNLDEIYNETNSSLQKRAIYDDWIEVGAIQFDSEGNLWCTNSQTYEPLSVKYTNGDWEAFSLGSGITETQDLAKLLIDKNDQKWVQLKNNGLVVFDESRQGIKSIKLTNSENAGNLVSNRVHSFAEDLEGEIWIGTDNGVCVFYDSNSIFQGENASQVVVALGDYNSYLLEGQQINDIEIDGANRKWFATNNSGVVVTSANGTEEIYHFTSENSPLFSNKVLDIEMNDVTGEVFFATEKGLISLRSESTQGNADFSDVLVFPNPVHPDYTGRITIKGLITDAVVKITDISGNLIYETVALGGQAVWDGKSFDGQKAHTGVYLVFCSDQEGTISHVTKLLFVRG
jgi:streptogramin lyase